MTTLIASLLTPDHVGRQVAFYADGKRICGHLDHYCRHTASYSIRVDGHLYRGVPVTSEIDLIEVTA